MDEKSSKNKDVLSSAIIMFDEQNYVAAAQILENGIKLAISANNLDAEERMDIGDMYFFLGCLYLSPWIKEMDMAGGMWEDELSLTPVDDSKRIIRNIPKAIDCFRIAAEYGNGDASFGLAEIYSDASYGMVNLTRAVSYCQKAVENGVEDSEEFLEKLKKRYNKTMKKEFAELQKEMAELKKTVDEYESWIKTEGAELEDMYAQLQFLKESESDTVPKNPFRLPEDYPLPREILQQHFPRTAKQCNFSGNWGYDVDHATIVKEFDPEINPDEKFDGVSLEYAFIDKRIREELIFNRQEGQRFKASMYDTIYHALHRIDGIAYDYILVEVTAFPEREWNELKEDWESHNCYNDDPEGRKRNLARKEACKITYQAEYYFNISDFMP